MKKIRVVVACILLFCMLFSFAEAGIAENSTDNQDSFINYQNTPSDIIGHKYFNELSLLIGIGIMECYEDNTLMPDEILTRVEAAALAARVMGSKIDMNDGDTPISNFSDVMDNYWGTKYINEAYSLGLMQGYGDKIFAPEDKLTYEQFAKILVYALGFDGFAQKQGGYPNGYISVAINKGILKDTDYTPNKLLSRASAGKMIANALEVPILKQTSFGDNMQFVENKDVTILSEYLKIFTGKGVVQATEHVAINGCLKAPKESVNIDNYIFCDISKTVEPMLGLSVKYYYTDDDYYGDAVLFAVPNSSNEIVSVNASDILSYSYGVYRYFDAQSDKTSSMNLDVNHTDIIYNGSIINDMSDEYACPESGSIRFIDNNADGTVDVADIKSYKSYLFNSIDTAKEIIYLKNLIDNSGASINYGNVDCNLAVKDKDLNIIGFDKLVKNCIVSVFESQDKLKIEIIVCNETIQGEITEITNDDTMRVRIEEKEYIVADNADKIALRIKTNAVFYLDFNGDIAYWDTMVTKSVQYGYCTKFVLAKEGLQKEFKFKALLSTGKVETFDVDTNVYVNGEKRKIGNKEDEEFITSTFSKPGVIGFELGDNGKVTGLYSAHAGTADSKLYDSLPVETMLHYRYTGIHSFGGKIIASKNVQVFVTPKNLDDEKSFSAGGSNLLVHNTDYTITAYKTDKKSNFSDIIVLHDSEGGGGSVSESAELAVVEKVTQVLNEDGANSYKIYLGVNGQVASYLYDPSKSSKPVMVDTGDVIRFSKENKNEIAEIDIMYDFSKKAMVSNFGNSSDFDYSNRIVAGEVVEKFDGCIVIENGYSGSGAKEYHYVNYADTLVYDGRKASNKVSQGNFDSIKSRDEYGEDASMVLLKTKYSSSYELIIINE